MFFFVILSFWYFPVSAGLSPSALAKKIKKIKNNKSKKHFKKPKTGKKPKKNRVGLLFFFFYVFFFGNFIFLVCSSICWAVAFIRLVCQFHVGMCWWIALWNSVWTICEVNQCISDLGLPSTVGISCFFLPSQDFLFGAEQHLPPKKWIFGAVDTSNPWLHPRAI